jgi:hypothetical protein
MKHENECLPARRAYTLIDDEFLRKEFNEKTFGWLRSIMQRVSS